MKQSVISLSVTLFARLGDCQTHTRVDKNTVQENSDSTVLPALTTADRAPRTKVLPAEDSKDSWPYLE
ncbi:hypothetical protein J6590_038942 [Homalodisca vitripennis]|nr:hypothetical protein J6590_038942 [Homalodisca vitripennis]